MRELLEEAARVELAEGEVGDVIVGGVLPPAGATLFEQMRTMEREHDHIRRRLLCEPRGSVARHVNLLVPSTRPDCVAGGIIMVLAAIAFPVYTTVKMRSNKAIDEWTSVETCSIEPIGKNRRDCSVVNATIVPAVIVLPVGSRLITHAATR